LQTRKSLRTIKIKYDKELFQNAWRNLKKSKFYSFINIGGLAIGMAVATIIGLWVWDELSFNKFHKNYDRIAQAWQFVNV
jgi:hypothetical protein